MRRRKVPIRDRMVKNREVKMNSSKAKVKAGGNKVLKSDKTPTKGGKILDEGTDDHMLGDGGEI